MKRDYIIGILLLTVSVLSSCTKEDGTSTDVPDTGNDTLPTYELVELSTTYGTQTIWLYDKTPLHKANFLKLAKEGFYDGTTFHRLVQNFVAQGGDPNTKDSDPNNDGQGGPGYMIPAEFNDSIHHVRGAIGAARNNNPQMASNGSQFYIVLANTSSTANLDGKYTVFGMVIDNMAGVDDMMGVDCDKNDKPLTPIPMSMKVIAKTKEQIKTDYGYEIPE